MAAALFRREFEERNAPVHVRSAGTGAWDGASASEGAYLIALENGLDLSQHRATLLTRALVAETDLILTMARHHRTRVEDLGGQGKTFVLGEYVGRDGDSAEVSDPFGGSLEVYRETYHEIERMGSLAVEKILEGLRENPG
jgi:protein-tyrosine-phosphatase